MPRGRRGGGIFTLLSGLAKKAVHFLLCNVAPEAMKIGKDILGDVLEGRRFRESVKDRGVAPLNGVGRRLTRGCRVKKKKNLHTPEKTKKNGPKRHRVAKSCYKSDIFDMKALV